MPAQRKYKRNAKTVISDAQLKRALASLKPAPRKRAVARAPRQRAVVPVKQQSSDDGGSFMGKIGSSLGKFAGNTLSKFLGFGDYQVSRNSLIGPDAVPYMHSTSSNVRICHKEFIKDITATSAFSVESLNVNPGLASTFPYLAGIAQNFESYRIHGMVFWFKSNSADALNSTNTALGTMIAATKYDVLGEDFTSKQGMEATNFANSSRPSSDFMHPIECAPYLSGPLQRYVRSGDLSMETNVANADLRLYDWCKVFIASQGMQATSIVGELWCTYDVELINPILTVPRGLNVPTSKLGLVSVTNTDIFGNAPTNWTINRIGLSATSAGVITIPAGSYGLYLLSYTVVGDSTASLALSAAYTTNVSGVDSFNAESTSGVTNGTTTATRYFAQYVIKLTDPTTAGTLTFSSATLPANASAGDLIVTQLNGTLA